MLVVMELNRRAELETRRGNVSEANRLKALSFAVCEASAEVGSQKLPPGAQAITAERIRQITAERWSAEYDDQHTHSQLLHAAGAYLKAAIDISNGIKGKPRPTSDWPWDHRLWKPSASAQRNIVKAGALIAAEWDRLMRVDNPPLPNGYNDRVEALARGGLIFDQDGVMLEQHAALLQAALSPRTIMDLTVEECEGLAAKLAAIRVGSAPEHNPKRLSPSVINPVLLRLSKKD